MQNTFEKRFYVRTSDFDCYNRLRPSSILDFFQDVAGEHADLLGIGREEMIKQDIAWVLTKIRYESVSDPRMFEKITVKTWPHAPQRLSFIRDYTISGEDGRLLVKGSSEWVLISLSRRRLVRMENPYPLTDFCADQSFPDGFLRLPRPAGQGEALSFVPRFSDLDVNGHVNNIRYTDYALELCPPTADTPIRAMQIEFHREVLPGVLLHMGEDEVESGHFIYGKNDGGELLFSCLING